MGDPISTRKLGGVTYNANQFKGEKLKNGRFKLTAKKTGETIIYSKQPKGVAQKDQEYYASYDYEQNGVKMREINPRIELDVVDGLLYDDNYFTLTDIMGATFSSSKDAVSKVKLVDCETTQVDLAANKSRLYGDNASIQGGQGNKVILDDKDSATINRKSIEGEGTADQKDYE